MRAKKEPDGRVWKKYGTVVIEEHTKTGPTVLSVLVFHFRGQHFISTRGDPGGIESKVAISLCRLVSFVFPCNISINHIKNTNLKEYYPPW
jgi:hypothetical protein